MTRLISGGLAVTATLFELAIGQVDDQLAGGVRSGSARAGFHCIFFALEAFTVVFTLDLQEPALFLGDHVVDGSRKGEVRAAVLGFFQEIGQELGVPGNWVSGSSRASWSSLRMRPRPSADVLARSRDGVRSL